MEDTFDYTKIDNLFMEIESNLKSINATIKKIKEVLNMD